MPVTPANIVKISLPSSELSEAIAFAYHVLTHADDYPHLASRDPLQCFIDVLMGELAERMVIRWLHENGKFAETANDKGATIPNINHEILVTDIRGVKIRASVKASLTATRNSPIDIIQTQTLRIKPEEIRGINIAVCFWLRIQEKHRNISPSLEKAAIIAWLSDKNLRKAGARSGKKGEMPRLKLSELRTMSELLQFLV